MNIDDLLTEIDTKKKRILIEKGLLVSIDCVSSSALQQDDIDIRELANECSIIVKKEIRKNELELNYLIEKVAHITGDYLVREIGEYW